VKVEPESRDRADITTPDDLGERLRSERESHGISLRELARRIGVSPSLISQIETGKVHPSVSTLYSLAAELGASVDHLLFEDGQFAGTTRQTPGSDPVRDHPDVPPVQRLESRKVIELSSGVRWERLTAASVPGFDFLYVVYEPSGESSPEGSMQRHAGREWGYVMSGELHVTIAFNDHVLKPGDSIAFDSTVPHRLHNPGEDEVHAVWFVLGRHSGHPGGVADATD